MKNLLKKYEELGFSLSIKDIQDGTFIVHCGKIKSKARFPKPEFHYKFRGMKEMEDYLNEFINRRVKILNDKEKEKQAIEKFKNTNTHNYKIGQVLYDSWGYDQTNIDFYQVVGIGKKSIDIQEISGKFRDNQPSGYSSMSAFVIPQINHFLNNPFKKRIIVTSWRGNPSFNVKSRHKGYLSNYTSGVDGVYQSWYA